MLADIQYTFSRHLAIGNHWIIYISLFISPGDVGKNQVLAKISSMAQPAREADTMPWLTWSDVRHRPDSERWTLESI